MGEVINVRTIYETSEEAPILVVLRKAETLAEGDDLTVILDHNPAHLTGVLKLGGFQFKEEGPEDGIWRVKIMGKKEVDDMTEKT